MNSSISTMRRFLNTGGQPRLGLAEQRLEFLGLLAQALAFRA